MFNYCLKIFLTFNSTKTQANNSTSAGSSTMNKAASYFTHRQHMWEVAKGRPFTKDYDDSVNVTKGKKYADEIGEALSQHDEEEVEAHEDEYPSGSRESHLDHVQLAVVPTELDETPQVDPQNIYPPSACLFLAK